MTSETNSQIDPELARLLALPEGERVERTERCDFDRFKAKLCKALSAFSNDLQESKTAAYFLIGVRDDGGLSGYRYTDADEQRIANWLSDGVVSPEPAVTFSKYFTPQGDVLALTVSTSAQAPHRFDKRIWVRIGNTTREATPHEENRIHEARRYRVGLTYDCLPCPANSLDDLDLEAFYAYRAMVVSPQTIEANQRPLPAQLAALNMYDLRQDCPTIAGLICFGKTQPNGNRRGIAGGAGTVQFNRIDGDHLVDTQVQFLEICTNLYATREKIDALLEAHVAMRIYSVGTTEQRRPAYPIQALREFVYNAIAHRDYSLAAPLQMKWFNNRVEIQSPGGLYPPATLENFEASVSTRRNPAIADAMRELGMIERRGSGITKAQHWLVQNGNPPAQFELLGGNMFRVTVIAN